MLPSPLIPIVTISAVAITATFHGPPSDTNFRNIDELHRIGGPYYTQDYFSICNEHISIILGSDTPTNQRLLMMLFVNTALVGNYTAPNVGVGVNGIMWPGTWKG
jgi:hypothetical protein